MYIPHDHLAQKAKQAGLRARSFFKLEEINNKYQLIKPGQNILDLGAAPGSWLEYVKDLIKQNGSAIGLDLQPIKPLGVKNIKTFVADVYDWPIIEKLLANKKFEAIISDMAPSTSGDKFVDSMNSLELLNQAYLIAQKYLKPNGNFVGKVFESQELNYWFNNFSKHFKLAKRFKPKASQEASKELFVIGKGYK